MTLQTNGVGPKQITYISHIASKPQNFGSWDFFNAKSWFVLVS